MNPFEAIASLVLGIYRTGKAQQWARLIFQMGFSALVTFLFVAGTALGTSGDLARGLGAGMVAAAIVLVIFFRRSPLTKGMTAVLPAEEAQKEFDFNAQEIRK